MNNYQKPEIKVVTVSVENGFSHSWNNGNGNNGGGHGYGHGHGHETSLGDFTNEKFFNDDLIDENNANSVISEW